MSYELLQKKIKTTQELYEIVKTMKMLSSVSILQYEQANHSLEKYRQNIKDCFHVLAINKGIPNFSKSNNSIYQLNILIGSDNSLVGKFNKEIIQRYKTDNAKSRKNISKKLFMTIGKKITGLAEQEQLNIVAKYPISNSIKAVNALTENILLKIDEFMQKEKINQVVVYFHKYTKKTHVTIERKVVLPIDKRIFSDLYSKKWENNNIPMINIPSDVMFSALIKETLMITLANLLNYSLAAEHYTRMTNMQNAEKNIEEKIEYLNQRQQQERQENITDELIDVISGAEAMLT